VKVSVQVCSTAPYKEDPVEGKPAGKEVVLLLQPSHAAALLTDEDVRGCLPSYAPYRRDKSKLTLSVANSYTIGSSKLRYQSPSPEVLAKQIQNNLHNRVGLP